MHRLAKLLLIAGLCSSSAFANPDDRQQPIDITAQTARFDDKAGTAVYQGNVIVRQGSLEIRGDRLTLKLNPQGQLSEALTEGNPARFQQVIDPARGLVRGEARQVLMQQSIGLVTLTGQALLTQEGARFSGPKIVYAVERRQIEATGTPNERVRLVLPPETNATRSNP